MIELKRKSFYFKILEKRYCSKLENNKSYDLIKIYSFQDLGKPTIETITRTLNLNEDTSKIFKGFNKNYQKHIKREEREKITVSIKKTKKDYSRFYKGIYKNLTKNKKLRPFKLKYLKQGDLWIAEKEEKWLAGQIIFHDKEIATQSFNVGTKKEYNGNRLITWRAINHYKKLGIVEFNFGGGDNDYKRRFGTFQKKVYIYEIINNKFYGFLRKKYGQIIKWQKK
jgi:hypothetical protein